MYPELRRLVKKDNDVKIELSNSYDKYNGHIVSKVLSSDTSVFTNEVGDIFANIDGVWYEGHGMCRPYKRILFISKFEYHFGINLSYTKLVKAETFKTIKGLMSFKHLFTEYSGFPEISEEIEKVMADVCR